MFGSVQGVWRHAELGRTIAECDIVLVIVGPECVGARDESLRRRIDLKDDWVRRE